MTFPDRIAYKKAILVYKSLNNMCPEYLNSKFQYTQTIGCQLRSRENNELEVPKPRIEFYRKSLQYSGSVNWNNIHKHI